MLVSKISWLTEQKPTFAPIPKQAHVFLINWVYEIATLMK
jgi:hypothetical protein